MSNLKPVIDVCLQVSTSGEGSLRFRGWASGVGVSSMLDFIYEDLCVDVFLYEQVCADVSIVSC